MAVVSCMVNGSADAESQNMFIGRSWLEVCRLDNGLMVYRVETHANPADEPTREEDEKCYVMKSLGAVLREPRLPEWAEQVWSALDFREDKPSRETVCLFYSSCHR